MNYLLRPGMPEKLRAELDSLIRQHAYQRCGYIQNWLATRGHEVAISTVWRYAMALQKKDGAKRVPECPETIYATALAQWPHRPQSPLIDLVREVLEARSLIRTMTAEDAHAKPDSGNTEDDER